MLEVEEAVGTMTGVVEAETTTVVVEEEVIMVEVEGVSNVFE